MNKPDIREKQLQAVRTPEHREKVGRWTREHQPMNNPETVQKVSELRKNGYWITDGVNNRYIHDKALCVSPWYFGLTRHKGGDVQ